MISNSHKPVEDSGFLFDVSEFLFILSKEDSVPIKGKMERALVMFNPDDSHTDDKTKRLQRLLRRRKARNDSLKHNRVVSASRTTAMICGNTNVLIDINDHKIDGDVGSHMSENLKSPNTNKKRKRLKGLLRRQEARSDSLKHNRVASASRTTAMICANTNVLKNKNDHTVVDHLDKVWKMKMASYMGDDELEEDYKSFLITYNPDNKNTSKEVDSDYATLLATYNPRVEIDSASNRRGSSNIGVSGINANHQVDADYQSFLPRYDPCHISDDVSVNEDDHRLVNLGSESLEQSSSVKQNSLVPVTIVDGDKEYMRGKNTTNTSKVEGSESLGQSSSVKRNSLVPVTIVDGDKEYMRGKNTTNTSKVEGSESLGQSSSVKRNSLVPVTIVDGDKEYMRGKNTTNTSKVEDGGNPCDPDVTILKSYPICEANPFVPSNRYDSSCFEEEMNPKDNMQIAAYDDSQFRRRLLEHLDRPYDHEEYRSLLIELCDKKQLEHQYETWKGEFESYDTEGVTTPYHVMYPDLSKVIAKESKNKRRVLFLLRGFFFYMKNVCHMGSFQPWLDESCLKLMRKI